MAEPRYPLSGKTPRHEVLHEGIPAWLREPVLAWLQDAIDTVTDAIGTLDAEPKLARAFDMYARLEDPLAPHVGGAHLQFVVRNRDDELVLDFIDYIVADVQRAERSPFGPKRLGSILHQGGSVWRVAEDDEKPHLERRVDDTSMAAADKAMAESGHAGKLLAEAWQKVYGRSPDPKGAYAKAVLAVEEIAAPFVIPDDPKPTLGKIASAMANQRNWRYVLHEGGKESAQDAPLHQVQELWHRDPRHADGKANYRDPSQQEAETAVFLAVGLVHMFHNGLIARRG